MAHPQSFADFVQEGKVSRALYTDPAVFEVELERIFGKAWVFLAHESQVKAPGDFIRTRLGRDRIIVARHSDGEVYAFHNRCAHRGAEVCHVDKGNATGFVCPYHAWSFRTDGSLASLPLPSGYGRDLSERGDDFGLERIARVASYRGFIFGSKAATGIDLEDFLGPEVRAAFDNFVDRAPDGTLEVAGGKTVQTYRANWKLQIENSIDLLHPRILHANAVDAANSLVQDFGTDGPEHLEINATRANGLAIRDWDRMAIAALPRGHCWMGGFMRDAVLGDEPEEAEAEGGPAAEQDWFKAYTRALAARHGDEKAKATLGFSRHNTIVYPNLFVNPELQQVRILHPISVDRTEQHGYIFRLGGAPNEMFHRAVRVLTATNSPASIVTSDDHEVFERIQEALTTGARDWVDWSRGLENERVTNEGRTGEGTNEVLMRNQHRAWVDYMTGSA